MHPARNDRGMALICNGAGLIESVIQGDFEQFDRVTVGVHVSAAFESSCQGKVLQLLAEAHGVGLSLGWELVGFHQSACVIIHCMAVVQDGNVLFSGGCSPDVALAILAGAYSSDQMQTIHMKRYLKKLHEVSCRSRQDMVTYTEVQNINNELSNMQREMIKKNHELALLNRQLQESEEHIRELNRSLERRVVDAVEELRLKDQLLINRGRQAELGDMLSNIAHQWRQPLNALTMLMGNLQEAQEDNDLTDDFLCESTATAERLIQKMSSTISDFRDFYSPDKHKERFSVRTKIMQTVEVVEGVYRSKGITISVEGDNDCFLYGFPGEYSQVILNLLGNARDAIVESAVARGCVTIRIGEQDDRGVVTVQDNGGGIPAEILDKLFEPYFSTKSSGTGIGLYMSKTIIERNMEGRIEVAVVEGGSVFTVSVPLAGGTP